MKINNFRGDLTDISAKKEALYTTIFTTQRTVNTVSVVHRDYGSKRVEFSQKGRPQTRPGRFRVASRHSNTHKIVSPQNNYS